MSDSLTITLTHPLTPSQVEVLLKPGHEFLLFCHLLHCHVGTWYRHVYRRLRVLVRRTCLFFLQHNHAGATQVCDAVLAAMPLGSPFSERVLKRTVASFHGKPGAHSFPPIAGAIDGLLLSIRW